MGDMLFARLLLGLVFRHPSNEAAWAKDSEESKESYAKRVRVELFPAQIRSILGGSAPK